MGGLVAEYYVLYGAEDVLGREPLPPPTYAGAANVRKLVLLGVPHRGSVEALEILDRGRRVGWRSISNEAIFTMPSMYQLLTPADAVQTRSGEGRTVGFDLYAVGAALAEQDVALEEARREVAPEPAGELEADERAEGGAEGRVLGSQHGSEEAAGE